MTPLLQTPPLLIYLLGNSLLILVILRFYARAQQQIQRLEAVPSRRLPWYHTRREAQQDLALAGNCLRVMLAWQGVGQWLLLALLVVLF